MHIDWTAFTPGPALFGGVLLGIAASLYIHFHGRILGISGIVSGLLRLQKDDMFWRICFPRCRAPKPGKTVAWV